MLGRIEIGGLVEHLGGFRQHHETVRKAGRNPQQTAIGGAERFPHPLAEGGRLPAQIDRDVEDLAADAANQLSLGLLNLVVKTADYVPPRQRLVVLHEGPGDTKTRQNPFVVAFEKEPTAIFKDSGLKDLHISNPGRYCLHRFTPFISARSIPASTSSNCCFQWGKRKPKVCANLSLESTELAGLLAGVGYSDEGIACTCGGFASTPELKISRAKPHHEVEPPAVMW